MLNTEYLDIQVLDGRNRRGRVFIYNDVPFQIETRAKANKIRTKNDKCLQFETHFFKQLV